MARMTVAKLNLIVQAQAAEITLLREAVDQNAISSHHIYNYLRQPDKLNFAIAGVGYQRSDGQYVYKYLEQLK